MREVPGPRSHTGTAALDFHTYMLISMQLFTVIRMKFILQTMVVFTGAPMVVPPFHLQGRIIMLRSIMPVRSILYMVPTSFLPVPRITARNNIHCRELTAQQR